MAVRFAILALLSIVACRTEPPSLPSPKAEALVAAPRPAGPSGPPLQCRVLWDCETDPTLIGLDWATFRSRTSTLGAPKAFGDQYFIFSLPLGCRHPPQTVTVELDHDRRVKSVRFDFRGYSDGTGDDCLALSHVDLDLRSHRQSLDDLSVDESNSVTDLIGKTDRVVVETLGFPLDASGGGLAYRHPFTGCRTTESVLRIKTENGVVTLARWRYEETGRECSPLEEAR